VHFFLNAYPVTRVAVSIPLPAECTNVPFMQRESLQYLIADVRRQITSILPLILRYLFIASSTHRLVESLSVVPMGVTDHLDLVTAGEDGLNRMDGFVNGEGRFDEAFAGWCADVDKDGGMGVGQTVSGMPPLWYRTSGKRVGLPWVG